MVEERITLGAIVILLTLVTGVVALLMNARKIRRENEADGRARTNEMKTEFSKVHTSLSERLCTVEDKITSFMPRSEIEAKMEHEKNNRQTADESLRRITDNLSRDVRDIMIGQSKIEQQHADTSNSVSDIKDTLKDMSRDLSTKFDKIASDISRLTSGHRNPGEINH